MQFTHLIAEISNPYSSEEDVIKLIDLGLHLPLKGVSIPGYWVKKVCRDLHGSDLIIQSCIGEGNGNQLTQVKLFELQQLIKLGVNEVASVLNVGAFRTNPTWCKIECLQLAQTAHKDEVLFTLKLPPIDFTNSEIIEICSLANKAGVDTLFIHQEHLIYMDNINQNLSSDIEKQIHIYDTNLLTETLFENFQTVNITYDQINPDVNVS
ncbi:hypothetical protein [Flammeovirga kamogawensis]|uniref:TIM barrel protein n=1 Tax=Flammeovirga kamogawensis TaxID=373891 RepID=A0ABX8GU31_9BACT|nr:hypothetical protein [Flammeovirga kamogawensis]MBB6459842.1 deoxyribose-phosphate aldolase [Flammeovirga kamogawensis]QWG07104.1 hypothetical protein KM029_17650 [Flammeovirga kamogawensis]TRX68925.1 hypothetical protein EO216_12640 [Flammeovirga kamogawensis]